MVYRLRSESMSIVLFIVFLIITIISFSIDDETAFLPTLLLIGSLILIVVSAVYVVDGRVIDTKIAMYQEENKAIETQMDVLVDKYMDYESKTLGDLKGESSITLVSLYPELKSDELVKQQIKVYTDNNDKIKQLKESKINTSTWKWWLYFGGK